MHMLTKFKMNNKNRERGVFSVFISHLKLSSSSSCTSPELAKLVKCQPSGASQGRESVGLKR